MAELEDQLQADIAGLEAEFAIQQQQILNEENRRRYAVMKDAARARRR